MAFFRYSPIDILSVCLPPLMLDFNGHVQQEWLRKEAGEVLFFGLGFYVHVINILFVLFLCL